MAETDEEGGRIVWVPDPIQEVERLKTIVEDDIENLEVVEKNFEETVNQQLGNHLLLYFTLAHSSIEQYSEKILSSRFCSEEYEPSEETINILEKYESGNNYLPQWERENLLYAEEVIGDGLKSQMAQTRRSRNALVHNPDERVTLSSIEGISDKIELAYSAATGIIDKWEEEMTRGDAEYIL